jgi:hypothetical protein
MVRPLRFTSTLRSTRLTAQLGLWLGAAFGICFLTGLFSHLLQHPLPGLAWPSRPVWLYRATQGLHVATGLALVPLLAAKLWSVYHRLFSWPPVRGLVHAAERGSVAVLVAAALFQVVTGILNVARWYAPMPFFFTSAHYWTAWLAIGALLLHIAVQLPVIRRGLSESTVDGGRGLSRRGLLTAVGTGAAVITLGAGVIGTATDPAWRLRLAGPTARRDLSLAELAAFPQWTVALPITCVEGWSATAHWTGIRVADLLALVGVPDGDAQVLVESLQRGGRYRTSVLAPPHARDPLTLLALRVNGQPLPLDHGYPARLIAPDRPGVMQTKWVAALTAVRP